MIFLKQQSRYRRDCCLLWLYKMMKVCFQLINITDQAVYFFFDKMMRYAMAEIGMVIGFPYVFFDFVFQVVNVNELNVKLVVKVFNSEPCFFICFSRCKIV